MGCDPRRRLVPPPGRNRGDWTMIDRHHRDPVEAAELTEQDLAIAALVGRYIERLEHHDTPCVHDLVAEPRSSATPPSRSCAPCSPATRQCVPTAMAPPT